MKKNLRILMVSHHYYPAIGGSEKYVKMLSEELVNRGHDITVYTTNSIAEDDMPRISFKFPFFHRAKNRAKLKPVESVNKVKVHRFNIRRRFYSFSKIPEMYKSFRSMNFDLVHAYGYHLLSSYKACRAAKKLNIPFVLSGIDVIVPETLPGAAKFLKRIYDKTKGKRLLKNSAAITALTKDQIKQYEALGIDPKRIKVINPCINIKKYRKKVSPGFYKKYGLNKKDKILLSVGRLVEHKGVQDIIEVLPDLSKKQTNLKLLVVGADHGYKSNLEELANKLGVKDRVIFTGRISDNELRAAYAAAHIFVLPSSMEGFGIVLLEAMASGTPCVAYDIANVRDVLQNMKTGYLVENKHRLGVVLSQLLASKNELGKLRKNCMEYMKTRSIEAAVDGLEEIYSGIYKKYNYCA